MEDITIIQGNCLEIALQSSAISIDQLIDVVIADPPYFLSRDGGTTSKSGKRTSVNKGEWDQPRSFREMDDYNRRWIMNCMNLLRPGGTIWIHGTMHNIYSCGLALQRLGYKILNEITWVKKAPPPNLGCRCFKHAHESILWATNGKGHRFHYAAMKSTNGGKQMPDVWTDISRASKHETRYGKHPTQKPEALVERMILASTNPGDLILDPFLGSGTTAVIAKRHGRRCIGIEQDAHWCEIARKRVADE